MSLADGTTLVHYRALAAIVEPSPYAVSKLEDPEMSKYLAVLEEAQSHSAVLPAPPGTIFQSQPTLTRWLELHYFTLTEALSVIEGHAAARVSVTTQGKQGEDSRKSFAALAAESLRLLRSSAAATVTLPRADGDEEEGVLARASFLVDTQRWDAFKDTVSKEAKRQGSLDFQVTGPWPPYDFVRMQFGG
jgi:Gas vesicle synthesis protein GvpL/GvpF